MRFSVIDNTDIKVSRLGFGTASLHHLFSSTSRQKLLHAAFQVGITHFDTAPYYGYGLSESDLGKFMHKKRVDLTVTTKVGLYPWGTIAASAGYVWSRKALGKLFPKISLPVVNWKVSRARNCLHASLKRLRTDYVEFLLLHEPEAAYLHTDEFYMWLQNERSKGTIRAWGVAGVSEHVIPWLHNKHPLATVIQTLDSIDQHEAEFVLDAHRKLQFTYGYLSRAPIGYSKLTAEYVLRYALSRNTTGTVLISTRRLERLVGLANVVQ